MQEYTEVINGILPKIIYAFHSEEPEAIASIALMMKRLLALVPNHVELKRLYALYEIHSVADQHPEEVPVILDWDEYEWEDEYNKYSDLFERVRQNTSTGDYRNELIYLSHNPAHCQALIELLAGDEWINDSEANKRLSELLEAHAQYESDKPSIAICYFTHGHPEAVEEVLENNASLFTKYEVDAFFLDDLHDETTKIVVERFNKATPNIYLIPTLTYEKYDISINNKFSEKKYDYIWLSKDRSYITEKGFQDLVYQAQKKRDAIMFGAVTLTSCTHSRLYQEPLKLYDDFSLAATSINTTIMRVDSVLESFQNGGLESDITQMPFLAGFYHYWMLFKGLALLPQMNVKVLRRPGIKILESDKASSGWGERTLLVWAKNWVLMNDALPDCYNPLKEKVVKEESTPWLFGSKEALMELKRKGGLTQDKFDEVREYWHRVSDVPIEEVEKIIAGSD